MAPRIVDSPLAYFQRRFDEDWLLGIDNDRYRSIAQERYEQLQDQRRSHPHLTVLISESDPAQFLGSFIAAISAKCSLFLSNPNWVETEWQQVLEIVQPDIIWGREVPHNFRLPSTSDSKFDTRSKNFQQTAIAIPTGGTSGNTRFALHTWESLITSIYGFTEYFQIETVNSCCILPLYHVSGLMQFLRSLVTGGQLWILSSKQLNFSFGETSPIPTQKWFISLVPTQLQRLLQNPESTQWLSRFQTVLLGGAPAWKELLDQARSSKIRLAPTYGMTETASQIVTLKPEDFLAGNNSCGRVLPHAKLRIDPEISTNYPTTGVIWIQTPSLALGYYPQSPEQDQFIHNNRDIREMRTDDLGFFDDRGYLHIVGRCSDKIITGGENVFPSEVEAAIQASYLVADICVIGVPHPTWGQAVAAVYIPNQSNVTSDQFSLALTQKLAKFKHPKYWIPVESLPRNDRGKVNRKAVLEIARSQLKTLEVERSH